MLVAIWTLNIRIRFSLLSKMVATKILLFCVLIGSGMVQAKNFRTIYEKTRETSNLNVSYDTRNSLLTFVTCEEKQHSTTGVKCNVSLETMDSKSEPAKCEFSLDKNVAVSNGHILTSSKVVVQSYTSEDSDKYYIQYRIFNFPDCKTSEIKFDFTSFDEVAAHFLDNSEAVSLNEDKTFNILYNDTKVCGNKLCKATYDNQGNRVTGPIASFVPVNHTAKYVKTIPSSQNFVVLELYPDEVYKISLIKPDGQVVLKEYETYDDLHDHDVSTSHGSISICSKTNSTIVECEILSYEGKMMRKFSADIGVQPDTISIQNLKGGKLLLLSEVSTESKFFKIDVDGSSEFIAQLPQLDSPIFNELDVENNEYCISQGYYFEDKLQIVRKCVDDSSSY